MPAAEFDPSDITQHGPQIRRVTYVGLAMNLGLAAVKLGVGKVASSAALVADGVHSLSDSASDVLILLGSRLWTAPADEDHPYGHGRIEALVTVGLALLLVAAAGGIGYRALVRLNVGAGETPGLAALGVALLALAAKEWLYHYTVRVGRRLRSSAVVANAWHHRTDSFSSIPVAIAIVGARIFPAWPFLDPIGALIVAAFIVQAAWRIGWPALRQLTDAGASEQERRELHRLAMDVPGVLEAHDIRARHIGPGLTVDLHVLVRDDLTVAEGHRIAGKVRERLRQQGPDVLDALVHLEPYGESSRDNNTP